MRNQPLPLNIVIILCLWVLVGGLAWADSFDLTDDVGIPYASAGVLVESDGDEVRVKLEHAIRTAVALLGHQSPETRPQLLPTLSLMRSVAQSQDPLYQRLRTLRL
ncbi:MAG: hypothetical protein NTX84_06570 [Nitrospirae bacterium]|nr:hypothetical protein [Nitrospirota bacterium]